MKNLCKRIVSFVLVISFVLTTASWVFAAQEVYLGDLRLVYADSYREAQQILADSEFKDYRLLNENLNEGTGEIGTWLAYKTTTDIEDAITDLAVMQMNGGYEEGNYQQMIQQSMEEYTQFGQIYQQAIDYFVQAYDAGDFLADAAYRQLNLYTTITDEKLGIKIPDYDGELFGDVLYNGIGDSDLATIFLQGNSYALQNIRSLLAMGVSYNQDGSHYLEKVAQEVSRLASDPALYAGEDYDQLALLISGCILTFQKMFKELSAYEGEMNYYDDQQTDLEIKYAEYKSFADRMREVSYLNGQTLYEFCLGYTLNKADLSSLYPLAAALNEGQAAMTRVNHYYDVVRYSMSDYPQETLEEMICEQEELYADAPFDIYTGVDRSIYYGSFALTSDAYRADAYTESGFLDYMFREQTALGVSSVLSFAGGTALSIWAVRNTLAAKQAAIQLQQDAATQFAANKAAAIKAAQYAKDNVGITTGNTIAVGDASSLGNAAVSYGPTYDDVANALLTKYGANPDLVSQPFFMKMHGLTCKSSLMDKADLAMAKKMNEEFNRALSTNQKQTAQALKDAQEMTQNVSDVGSSVSGATVALYVAGGLLLLYSVISLGLTVAYYYNPTYDDVPVALVDLVETSDGDRYIKYDVVYEAQDKKGKYSAGDLNAFEAQRWNALYYTKSYEAGKPLLADEFSFSNSNNKAKTGYAPVHRFGEVVCYDLNKYNFNDDTSIYLSVKQSKNDKSAVAQVPQVVGSIFTNGFWLLFGASGALVGMCATLGAQKLWGIRKKTKNEVL